jgi:hypothetical protein
MFTAMTGNDMPEEVTGEVKTRLIKFFKENPTRCFPDPTLFKDLMDSSPLIAGEQRSHKDNAQKIDSLMIGAPIIKSILAEDLLHA